MLGKLKKSMAGAKEKIKAASSDLLDSTQMKLAGRQFRVNGKKYKVKKLIAEGGFGYVYLVEDEVTGQLRALKHMLMQTREARDQTIRELELLTSLPNSPYLVSVVGSEVVRGPPDEAFVVMELCTGGNLADLINVAGPGGKGLPESRIWNIFWQVCNAVSVLHEQSPIVIHRDIKAENVLLCDDGTYKLCDFGSAKREMVFPSSDSTRNEIQEDIDRYTTMVYRSPEMVDLYLEKWIGDKVDVWALGCLLFKMAYVVTPFEEGGRLGILNARVEFPQTLSSASYSEELRSTIKWLLTPDPEERPNIFDVLERVAKYNHVKYSKKDKRAPQHPPDPAGFGASSTTFIATPHHASLSNPASTSVSSAARTQLFDALEWQSSGAESAPPQTFQTPSFASPNDFFPTNTHHNNFDFFPTHAASTDAHGTPIQFASLSHSSPSVDSPGSTSWATFDAFGSSSSQSTASGTASPAPQFAGATQNLLAPKATHAHPPSILSVPTTTMTTNNSNANGETDAAQLNAAASRSHRRSVSDSSALSASLAATNISSSSNANAPVNAAAVVQPDVTHLATLVATFVASDSKVPSVAVAREILTYTWSPPRQPYVSKIFQCLAPKLGSSPHTSLKGLHLVHRLLSEGSDCVLTLCLNKLDYFRNLAAGLEASNTSEFWLLNERYSQYLVKKLEFHQAFEACFEGSYALDAYFQRLRIEGKKLQIGAADSPIRRQAVPALLELQLCAITLAEQCLTPTPNNPDASSLKLRLSLPVFSDICALLLLLQYVTTKLLATKTDFTKAILQYEEQYAKIVALFSKLATIATSPVNVGFSATESSWVQKIKMPAFPPTAPAIVKGATNVASPPSVDPAVSSSVPVDRLPSSIIHEPLSDSEHKDAMWTWQCLVAANSQIPQQVQQVQRQAHMPTSNSNTTAFGGPSLQPSTHGAQIQQQQALRASAHTFDAPSFSPSENTAFSASNFSSVAFTPPPTEGGFTQGDPFSLSSSSSSLGAPLATATPPILNQSGEMFVPSTSQHAVDFGSEPFAPYPPAQSTPPLLQHNQHQVLQHQQLQHHLSDTTFAAPAPKRALAQSADQGFFSSSPSNAGTFNTNSNQLSLPTTGQTKSHRKQTSDQNGGGGSDHRANKHFHHGQQQSSHQPQQQSWMSTPQKALQSSKISHSSSGPSMSSGSDAASGMILQTSEDKLKNKDRMNAQASEFSTILSISGNGTCFDCGDVAPKWLSLNLGVFICYRCAGVHRSFGSHISKVRSVELDVLSPEQISFFRHMGNAKAAQIWLAFVPSDRTEPDRNTAQSELERFLRDKYVFEEFKDKTAEAQILQQVQAESSSTPTPSNTSSKKAHQRTLSHQ